MILSNQNITDIIWIQTAFIGDIVLTSAAINLVATELPHIKQHLITTKAGKSVFEHDSRLSSITVFDKGSRNIFKSFTSVKKNIVNNIESQRTTIVMQPHRSARSSLLARFLRTGGIVTYEQTNLSFLSSIKIKRNRKHHESLRIAQLLQALNIDNELIMQARPSLEPKTETQELPYLLQEILKTEDRLIAIAPGSQWGTKQWTKKGFTQLIKMLLSHYSDIAIILIGGKAEVSLAKEILYKVKKDEEAINTDKVYNMVGKTSLSDLNCLFPRLSLVVTGDSSPVHLASGYNIPTVAIFGPTVPKMGFAPLADKSLTVEVTKLSCRPCHHHGPKTCPLGHFKCMNDISPTMVFEACQSLLDD